MAVYNVQRLKETIEATGCPVAHLAIRGAEDVTFVPGAGATAEQIQAAQNALAVYEWSADDEWEKAHIRLAAQQAFDAGFGRPLQQHEIALRAFFLMIIEDRYNTVTQFNALLAQIGAATSLADLKARVAANVQTLPTYGATLANSINAVKNALKQRIGRGDVD